MCVEARYTGRGVAAPTLAAVFREIPWSILRGYLMGAADIVPGVSGGTIALVLGIYERLIASVRAGSSALGSFVRLDFSGGVEWLRKVDWGFILPLGAGIGLAIISLSHLLENLLRDHAVLMASLFLGLVAGSALIVWRLLTVRDLRRIGIIVAVTVVVFVLLGLREDTSSESAAQIANPETWAYFLSGAVAICAMILPGISGSFILVMLGMYGPVLSAVTSRDIVSLAVFGVGAIIGLALFSQVLHRALRDHYNSVMAALIGLMLGSLRVLWPWPRGVDSTALQAPNEDVFLGDRRRRPGIRGRDGNRRSWSPGWASHHCRRSRRTHRRLSRVDSPIPSYNSIGNAFRRHLILPPLDLGLERTQAFRPPIVAASESSRSRRCPTLEAAALMLWASHPSSAEDRCRVGARLDGLSVS